MARGPICLFGGGRVTWCCRFWWSRNTAEHPDGRRLRRTCNTIGDVTCLDCQGAYAAEMLLRQDRRERRAAGLDTD